MHLCNVKTHSQLKLKLMKTIKKFTIICLFVVALNAISYGQTDSQTSKIKYNTWSATLSGGSMLFNGDLKQFYFYPISRQNGIDWYNFSTAAPERNLGFGLTVSKQITPIFGVRGDVQKGKLSGVKISDNAYFKADFWQYSLNGTVNFINLFFPNCKSHFVTFYGITGVGIMSFKTMEKKISTDEEIMSYGYGHYGQSVKRTVELAIPVGLGVKCKLSPQVDIGVEGILNNVNTDKLDGVVSSNYSPDKYMYTSLTLTYKIGKNLKSLEWVNAKEIDSDNLSPVYSAVNKKVDSLGMKLKDVKNDVNAMNEIDGNVDQLKKDVSALKNPPKEADDDNDGVPNSKDLEPNTPKGSLVNFEGITIPKAETVTSTSTTNFTEIKVEAPLFSIYFDVNSTKIDNLNKEKIASAAKMLIKDPNLNFKLVGYTDKTGNISYNEKLSEKRAQAVYNMLVKSYRIDKNRITLAGDGISGLSSDDLNINRRVDFVIKK